MIPRSVVVLVVLEVAGVGVIGVVIVAVVTRVAPVFVVVVDAPVAWGACSFQSSEDGKQMVKGARRWDVVRHHWAKLSLDWAPGCLCLAVRCFQMCSGDWVQRT